MLEIRLYFNVHELCFWHSGKEIYLVDKYFYYLSYIPQSKLENSGDSHNARKNSYSFPSWLGLDFVAWDIRKENDTYSIEIAENIVQFVLCSTYVYPCLSMSEMQDRVKRLGFYCHYKIKLQRILWSIYTEGSKFRT